MSIVNLLPMLIGITFILVIIAIIQTFLSKTRNKWIGLILPLLFFTLSILSILSIVKIAYLPDTSTVKQTYENGNLISKSIITMTKSKSLISDIFLVFFSCNIPTVISSVIYALCRKKRGKLENLKKMSIQDLQ
jgi:hypothetical protein